MLSDLLIGLFPLTASGLPCPPDMEHKLEDLLGCNNSRRKLDAFSTLGDWALDLVLALTVWFISEAPEFERDLVISVAAKASHADCTRSLCISLSSYAEYQFWKLLLQCERYFTWCISVFLSHYLLSCCTCRFVQLLNLACLYSRILVSCSSLHFLEIPDNLPLPVKH